MAQPHTVGVEHATEVRATAESVYRLLADIGNWPRMFRPFVHLESLGTEGGFERIGMWTTSGDEVVHWVARRRLDERGLRVEFRPEVAHPPLESMRRSWVVEPSSGEECLVRLVHEYRVAGDDPAGADTVRRMIDEVAEGELAALRTAAEQEAASPDLRLVLDDAVRIAGSAAEVYEFLYSAQHWPERLPHVARAEVREGATDTHLLEMDTHESQGGVFTTRTARVGRPNREIAYKQLLLPPLGSSHHVRWRIEETGAGVTVRSRQVVVINLPGVERLLGSGADLAQARSFVRRELDSKVRLVLDGAKAHVER